LAEDMRLQRRCDDMSTDDQRLSRIEAKLDKLAEVMTLIARVEEKIVANQDRVNRMEVRIDEHDDELTDIMSKVASNTNHVKAAERIVWLAVSSGIGTLAYYLR